MIDKVITEVKSEGRVSVPAIFLELAKIRNGEFAYLCKCDEFENALKIRSKKNLRNCKVIAKVTFEKYRFIFPVPFRNEIKKLEVFFYNGSIILKEVS